MLACVGSWNGSFGRGGWSPPFPPPAGETAKTVNNARRAAVLLAGTYVNVGRPAVPDRVVLRLPVEPTVGISATAASCRGRQRCGVALRQLGPLVTATLVR